MSRPFIIWCLQRTGSISLFNALKNISEYPAAESEPFHAEIEKRQFSHITQMSYGERHKELTKICQHHWLIKHVYEYTPIEFQVELANTASNAGYRHIHLFRKDELSRLISLGIAEQNIVWIAGKNTRNTFERILSGKQQIKPLQDVNLLVHRSRCNEQKWHVIAQNFPHINVPHEELFNNNALRRHAMLTHLLNFLELPLASIKDMDEYFYQSGQDTDRILHLVPNLDELRTAYLEYVP